MIRAVRRRRRLRQIDVGALARVDQTVVSRVERGHLEEVSLARLRRIARALDIQLSLAPRWRGGELDRLLDQEHALVVEQVVATLRVAGWETVVEYGFNVYGERGSVDVVGWNAKRTALLLIEAKTRLVDLQDLLASVDRKARVAPRALATERGWRASVTARALVVVGTTANRRVVSRHEAIFASAFPGRWVDLREWLRRPEHPVRALWMMSPRHLAPGKRPDAAPHRVRRHTVAIRGRDPPDPEHATAVRARAGSAGNGIAPDSRADERISGPSRLRTTATAARVTYQALGACARPRRRPADTVRAPPAPAGERRL